MTRLLFMSLLAISLNFACQNSASTTEQASDKPTEISTEVVQFANEKDPVCGMSIDSTTVEIAEHDGKKYGFCSASCKADFLQDPAKYLSAK